MQKYTICVISDSHGRKNDLFNLISENNFDYIFYLGDGLSDLDDLIYLENLDQDRIIKVKGNCDIFSAESATIVTTINNVKVLLTHGHLFKVKYTIKELQDYASKQNVNLVCFGHTHKQFLQITGGTTLLNPGSLRNGDYAVVSLDENGGIGIDFKKVNDFE